MITNQEDLEKYESQNKIYIPEDYINENWQYKINGENITIITNQNCTTQYTSTYCNCYTYMKNNNLVSEVYSCNTNNNNATISYSDITNDINYSSYIRNTFMQDKSILIMIIILGILFAQLLLKERNY